MIPPPPGTTLFPYTTLFRSVDAQVLGADAVPRRHRERVADQPVRLGIRARRRPVLTVDDVAVRAGGRAVALHARGGRGSEEHTSELQSRQYLVCRLLLEKKK